MIKQKTNISLQLLLLNDLLHDNVIDKSIYDKAIQKIISDTNDKQAA